MTILTSRNGILEFGPGLPTLLINDQLRVMDQAPEMLSELRVGCIDRMLDLARWGKQVGLEMVDILINHPDLDEVSLLPRIAAAVHTEVGCPISLDSRDPEALEAALAALRPHKALVNSVTAEKDSLETLLPIVKKYGAVVVGMPVGHRHGLPKTVEGRLEEASVIIAAAEALNIPRDDIVIDAVCLASAAEPDSMRITLETIQALHREFGVTTTLGIGNAGFGMPGPTQIDLAYLIAAIPWGLDSALVNPATIGLIEATRAVDFLTGRDIAGRRYIQLFRAKKKKNTV
jgi:5-methyltetrahydrofolate--homocysteine methyltransferase